MLNNKISIRVILYLSIQLIMSCYNNRRIAIKVRILLMSDRYRHNPNDLCKEYLYYLLVFKVMQRVLKFYDLYRRDKSINIVFKLFLTIVEIHVFLKYFYNYVYRMFLKNMLIIKEVILGFILIKKKKFACPKSLNF